MKVGTARARAAEWVMQQASREAGFCGAYFSGSTTGMPDEAELPAASDIDVMIVTDQGEPPLKLGKFTYRDTLVEATYLSLNQLSSVEEVLTSHHLATSLRTDTIIADPTGQLSSLQTEVSRHFAEMVWVRRRCENVLQKIESGLQNLHTSKPLYHQVTALLFPTGITTHVILLAALRNPTVRLRYLAARSVLREYGHAEFYTELLELLGCAHLTPQRVEQHLTELARTFDAAASVSKTPFFFSTDITAASRPIAIDGSRELIRAGNHREAVFWIVATYARCHNILAADGPQDLQHALAPAFEAILEDLGIASVHDRYRRAENVIQFLPRLWEITEEIMQANPDITAK